MMTKFLNCSNIIESNIRNFYILLNLNLLIDHRSTMAAVELTKLTEIWFHMIF